MTISQPADKSHFILPDLGEGVHEAELIKWCVQVGDDVAEHQTLAEMETDKALVEVPSPWSGTISSLHGEPGETLLVGNKLVSYATSPSASPVVDDVPPDTGCVVGAVESDMTMPKSFARTPDPTTGKPMATPAVRRLARDLDVNLQSIQPTGRGG
ncbi:MAG: biotin/lipoyl-containing protein, partial [Phycisphaerales bacterium]|nr:biotin/lipoyl-containing protein [Phycisphaerales bacterium]